MRDMVLVLRELERQRKLDPQPPSPEVEIFVPNLSTEPTGDPLPLLH